MEEEGEAYNAEEIAELQAKLDADLAEMFAQLQVRARAAWWPLGALAGKRRCSACGCRARWGPPAQPRAPGPTPQAVKREASEVTARKVELEKELSDMLAQQQVADAGRSLDQDGRGQSYVEVRKAAHR